MTQVIQLLKQSFIGLFDPFSKFCNTSFDSGVDKHQEHNERSKRCSELKIIFHEATRLMIFNTACIIEQSSRSMLGSSFGDDQAVPPSLALSGQQRAGSSDR